MKVYLLSENEKLSLSHGRPPITQRNPQKHVVFLSRRREGETPLVSSFSTLFEPVSELRAGLDVEKVTRLDAGNGTEAAKVEFKDGRLLVVFISEGSADFTVDALQFTGCAGAVLLDKAANQGRAYVAGPGEILYRGKPIVSAGTPFEAIITDVLLEEESILLDRPVPQVLAGKMFRVGRYAYRVASISGNRVNLLGQSMLRGRARLLKYSSDDHKSGQLLPAPLIARDGMSLYKGDDKATFVSRTSTLANGKVEAEVALELNIDYWISECAPWRQSCLPTLRTRQFCANTLFTQKVVYRRQRSGQHTEYESLWRSPPGLRARQGHKGQFSAVQASPTGTAFGQ